MVFCKKYGSFLVGYRNSPYLCIAFENEGRLAQLVQSVCLTSRGSGVRIPQRPQYRIVHKRVPTSVLELFFRLWGIL